MNRHTAFVEQSIERLKQHTGRDGEFLARFGKWQRPNFLPRYKLDTMKSLIRWHPCRIGQTAVFDVEPLLRVLRTKEDRQIASEIAQFVAEEFYNQPATDKTLGLFRLNVLRRLDACGF